MSCLGVDQQHGYSFFQCEYKQPGWKTEDYFFCELWRALGEKIYIYPNISFTHLGKKLYSGNYFDFLSSQPPPIPVITRHEKPTYSIVIVAYDGEDALKRCLLSLLKNRPERPAEIILVDNSPKPVNIEPGLWLRLRSCYTRTVVIRENVNLGFAEGCNAGANHAMGDFLVFVNPDTQVYTGWAEGLSKHLTEGVGAVGPISNYVAGHQNFVFHYKPNGRVFNPDTVNSEVGHLEPRETKLLIGFFLMVPKMVWLELGGFDPALILGCDDLDYSLRLSDAGYKMKIVPSVFVYHEGHVSFKAKGDEAMRMNEQSERVLLSKLEARYGDNIPTSTEIWGCEIQPIHVLKEKYKEKEDVCI
jgi:GT2 family glycosyltransferase